MMALLKFIDFFLHFSVVATGITRGGYPFDVTYDPFSGPVALSCGWTELRKYSLSNSSLMPSCPQNLVWGQDYRDFIGSLIFSCSLVMM